MYATGADNPPAGHDQPGTTTRPEVTAGLSPSTSRQHIAEGNPGDCGWCPVALAIADALPGLAFLAVRYLDIDVRARPEEDVAVIVMPDEVVRFIRAFDVGDPVQPFSFELDYPAEVTA